MECLLSFVLWPTRGHNCARSVLSRSKIAALLTGICLGTVSLVSTLVLRAWHLPMRRSRRHASRPAASPRATASFRQGVRWPPGVHAPMGVRRLQWQSTDAQRMPVLHHHCRALRRSTGARWRMALASSTQPSRSPVRQPIIAGVRACTVVMNPHDMQRHPAHATP